MQRLKPQGGYFPRGELNKCHRFKLGFNIGTKTSGLWLARSDNRIAIQIEKYKLVYVYTLPEGPKWPTKLSSCCLNY